jgi:hypothetical protein
MSDAAFVLDRHQAFLAGPTRENRFVLFYEDDEFLVDSVGRFVASGLAAGDPIVLIATAAHQRALYERLGAELFDVAGALRSARLTILDARETLSSFMEGGSPDPVRFAAVMGRVLDDGFDGRPRTTVRAYGEMVDLLCRDGAPDAAVRLEHLWNDLGKRYPFCLFCAYAMESFANGARAQVHARVCEAHAHALPAPTASFR